MKKVGNCTIFIYLFFLIFSVKTPNRKTLKNKKSTLKESNIISEGVAEFNSMTEGE